MKTFFSILLIILAGDLFSNGMIRGFVKNPDGVPLSQANVTVIATTLGSASDDTGKYVIRAVKPGTYILKCSYVGYKDGIQRGVTVEDDQFTEIDFTLEPIEYTLRPLEVSGATEDVNSLLRTRKIILPQVFEAVEVDMPESGEVKVNIRVGFWERFMHFFRRKS